MSRCIILNNVCPNGVCEVVCMYRTFVCTCVTPLLGRNLLCHQLLNACCFFPSLTEVRVNLCVKLICAACTHNVFVDCVGDTLSATSLNKCIFLGVCLP